ncbi:MAG: division/cell wall cluster transcriptional repressor MraZ [Capsulimonadales bacterium]|nr:division/cell wall cluster transcriptional repressor MraZ [Capsulimonadales bacterium]
MFRGAHYHSVDDKGRVIIPLRFRNELGNTFIITKGLDKCLFVFREDDFVEMEKKLQAQPALDRHTILLQRWLSAEALETQVDNQGRVAIPGNLREFAGIVEEVVIVGAGSRIEIWSRAGWDAFNASLSDELIARSAAEVGLGK